MQNKISFSKGTFQLHSNPNFNYQLNRTFSWSNGDLDELKTAAPQITSIQTWKTEMMKLAENAFRENRIKHAIAYYRMAEFFMVHGDPDKLKTYDKAVELFYEYNTELFASGIVKKDRVPFGTGYLPVMYVEPENGKPMDTIVLHGGYDSYMEEFLQMILYLRDNGFAVYLFEGPGQGGVLRKEGMIFTPEWEKPVKAILDFFKLDDVSIIGLSLGAMLAPRAAAFEPRIKRVVAWSLLPNLFDLLLVGKPKVMQDTMRFLMENGDEETVNYMMGNQMKKDPQMEWAINHGMHNMGARSPYEFLSTINKFTYLDIADRITQDFLLIGAERDHFIPVEFYKPIIDRLINVHSLTYRLFTEREQAENHCNAGNTKLVLDTVISWIKLLKSN
ncbi:pimeloyl-ACP methyl ester carboxylesterase [Sporomusaceae bacterium BoRhaA]|uniref:alpha/beta hydrolase family protein n=1 Tax=Pelorhabdus rhamnosifermentans TaxID=2772457 RepID=UPI001C061585|nr:alpha/beta hydrolase [Pelorhabdus rhamnosifermentans]MBU2702314.1 pimeloyl-ACP methyl ester carboxylesterase [Pelorhabdus rhamnosifermentans]